MIGITDDAHDAFFSSRVSAKIDAIDFAGKLKADVAKKLAGVLCRQRNHFTLHDPSPNDLEMLGAYEAVRLELAIDFVPNASEDVARLQQLEGIYSFITRSLYPFHARGVQVSWRTHLDGTSTLTSLHLGEHDFRTPQFSNVPNQTETLYIGHDEHYRNALRSVPNWVEIKVYNKQMDMGRELPPATHCIRIEATIHKLGMHGLGLTDIRAFGSGTFSLRKTFSPYFRFIDVRKVETRVPRRAAGLTARMVKAGRTALIKSDARVGGAVALSKTRYAMVTATSSHVEANKKVGAALGNLSRTLKR